MSRSFSFYNIKGLQSSEEATDDPGVLLRQYVFLSANNEIQNIKVSYFKENYTLASGSVISSGSAALFDPLRNVYIRSNECPQNIALLKKGSFDVCDATLFSEIIYAFDIYAEMGFQTKRRIVCVFSKDENASRSQIAITDDEIKIITNSLSSEDILNLFGKAVFMSMDDLYDTKMDRMFRKAATFQITDYGLSKRGRKTNCPCDPNTRHNDSWSDVDLSDFKRWGNIYSTLTSKEEAALCFYEAAVSNYSTAFDDYLQRIESKNMPWTITRANSIYLKLTRIILERANIDSVKFLIFRAETDSKYKDKSFLDLLGKKEYLAAYYRYYSTNSFGSPCNPLEAPEKEPHKNISLEIPPYGTTFKSFSFFETMADKTNKILPLAKFEEETGLGYVSVIVKNKICSAYTVAMASYYTQDHGDVFKITTAGGSFYAITMDQKSDMHTDFQNRFTCYDGSIVEFYVDRALFSEKSAESLTSGDVSTVRPEFSGRILSVTYLFNVFKDGGLFS